MAYYGADQEWRPENPAVLRAEANKRLTRKFGSTRLLPYETFEKVWVGPKLRPYDPYDPDRSTFDPEEINIIHRSDGGIPLPTVITVDMINRALWRDTLTITCDGDVETLRIHKCQYTISEFSNPYTTEGPENKQEYVVKRTPATYCSVPGIEPGTTSREPVPEGFLFVFVKRPEESVIRDLYNWWSKSLYTYYTSSAKDSLVFSSDGESAMMKLLLK